MVLLSLFIGSDTVVVALLIVELFCLSFCFSFKVGLFFMVLLFGFGLSTVVGVFTAEGLTNIRSGALITFQNSRNLGLALTLHENNTVSAVTLRGHVKSGDTVFGETGVQIHDGV